MMRSSFIDIANDAKKVFQSISIKYAGMKEIICICTNKLYIGYYPIDVVRVNWRLP